MNEQSSRNHEDFCCPSCGSRVYRSSRHSKQVYKCNNLTNTDCVLGREAVGRTKPQVRRAVAELEERSIESGSDHSDGGDHE